MTHRTLNLDDFLTKDAFLERYPGLISRHQLEWMLRYRDENGLASAVKQLGRKLVIHVPTFTEWLDAGGQLNIPDESKSDGESASL